MGRKVWGKENGKTQEELEIQNPWDKEMKEHGSDGTNRNEPGKWTELNKIKIQHRDLRSNNVKSKKNKVVEKEMKIRDNQ